MMIHVLDFDDYKAYLLEYEKTHGSYVQGFRTRLAQAVGCQNGYVTRVLAGDANFNLEQACSLKRFLNLNDFELKYFLLLVQRARAGTLELQSVINDDLSQMRDQHQDIKHQIGPAKTLIEVDQATYYSSWVFSAIHVLVSLPETTNIKYLATRLRISTETVQSAIQFLLKVGIIEEKDGNFQPGLSSLHLDKNSPFILQHHQNARLAAIQSLISQKKLNLHYSTMSALSLKDVEILRSELVDFIRRYVARVSESEEEIAIGFNVDMYLI